MKTPLTFQLFGELVALTRPVMLLFAAAVVAFGLWTVVRIARRRNLLPGWLAPRLQPAAVSAGTEQLRVLIGAAGLALMCVAAAGPRWGLATVVEQRTGADVAVVVDASHSMFAADEAPTRMKRAKLEISALLDQLRGDRVALVTFAKQAFLQMPLTADYAAARTFLRAIDPLQMQQGGTDVAAGLDRAVEALEASASGAGRTIVLLTDGEDFAGQATEAAARVRAAGIRLVVVAVGTEAGAPVPAFSADGRLAGYKRTADGQTAWTRLDAEGLRGLASAGGGELLFARSGPPGEAIARALASADRVKLESSVVRSMTERYAWFALPGVLLFALAWMLPAARRRGGAPVAAAVAVAALCLAGGAEANPLRTPDSKVEAGRRAFAEGKYDASLEAFVGGPSGSEEGAVAFNRGAALFKLDRLDEAIEAFAHAEAQAEGALAADAAFNRGDALAQTERREEAIAAFRRALEHDPDHDAARRNLEILLREPDESGSTRSGGSDASGKQSGGADKSGSQSGGADASGSQSGGSDTSGSQAGGADASGKQSGGADTSGSQSGGADTSGSQAGGADASGKQSGGTDNSGSQSAGSDASGKQSGGSDKSGSQSGGADASGKQSGGADTSGKQSGGADESGKQSGGSEPSGSRSRVGDGTDARAAGGPGPASAKASGGATGPAAMGGDAPDSGARTETQRELDALRGTERTLTPGAFMNHSDVSERREENPDEKDW